MLYRTANNAIITLGDTDVSGKGRHFKSRFVQPGVAGYPGQFGNVLITKETFDKFINTMVGVPVIINHKEISKNNADDERVGVVSSVWYDDKDGWYWCDGVIWDETAQNLITEKGWSVSCSYDVLKADDEGGTENNIAYDMEFLDGVFTHLALVDNPRYERANIVFNSKTVNKKTVSNNIAASVTTETLNLSNNIIDDLNINFNPNMKQHEVNNEKELDMALIDELKKLINRVENTKEGDEMDKEQKENVAENEKVDKRKLIDEVGGILKGKVDEEVWRTIIGKIEKIGYNESEAGSADNECDKSEEKADNKKVKNESEKDKEEVKDLKEDMKKDVDNSVNNSKTDFFAKMNEVYNASQEAKEETTYVSRADKLKAGEELFKV